MQKYVIRICTAANNRRGHADKKLDREGERIYTYEERMRAVKAYIGSGYQANKTIQELGYPSHEALRNWYREYQKNGDLHRDFIRVPLHTEAQKAKAVAHYYAHGCNYTKPRKLWDMSMGIVCINGYWKQGRRRDSLVKPGEVS